MKMRDEYTCPLEFTHDIVKGKWKLIIMFQMRKGEQSLSSLKKDISGISEKMLLEHLGELIKFGMVKKKSFTGYPLKVEYSLDKRGKKMLDAIMIMQNIGIDIMKEDGKTDFLMSKNLI
jgi:DNA-binding HxlR family transcriptional regulator